MLHCRSQVNLAANVDCEQDHSVKHNAREVCFQQLVPLIVRHGSVLGAASCSIHLFYPVFRKLFAQQVVAWACELNHERSRECRYHGDSDYHGVDEIPHDP